MLLTLLGNVRLFKILINITNHLLDLTSILKTEGKYWGDKCEDQCLNKILEIIKRNDFKYNFKPYSKNLLIKLNEF